MISIDKKYSNEIVIKKSKFLSFAYPVFSVEDISIIIENLKKEFSDATHICYAYITHLPNMEKAYDDNEPQGTAGKPILEVIKKKKLTNIIIVVVRYFGGVKLGGGGLIRAYSSAAQEVLNDANLISYDYVEKFEVSAKLINAKSLKEKITILGGEITKQNYSEDVTFEVIGNITDILSENENYKIAKLKKVLYATNHKT